MFTCASTLISFSPGRAAWGWAIGIEVLSVRFLMFGLLRVSPPGVHAITVSFQLSVCVLSHCRC